MMTLSIEEQRMIRDFFVSRGYLAGVVAIDSPYGRGMVQLSEDPGELAKRELQELLYRAGWRGPVQITDSAGFDLEVDCDSSRAGQGAADVRDR